MALNSETYISIRPQELRTCKRIGYEFYCEKHFVVKHKSYSSCESAIYFDLGPDIFKENNFDNLTETLEFPIVHNRTTLEQTLQMSLQSFEFDSDILKAPKTLKDLVC